jgi:hypothetical protein
MLTRDPHQETDDAGLAARFEVYAEWWRADTVDVASPREKFEHYAYRQIIALGWPVVPYILKEMRERGGYWFEALKQITGGSPVRPEERNSYDAVRHAWLEWGSGRRPHVRSQ